jgi:hypothetical protein
MARWGEMVGLLAVLLLLSEPCWAADQAAVPDGCPLRFDQMTTGLPQACLFVGRYNQECGQDAVAMFAGDGTALVVGVSVGPAMPTLFLPAKVLSGTEGKLVAWRQDLELRTASGAGQVALENGGRQLRILPGSVLQTSGCAFAEFVGQFAGMVSAVPPSR